VRRESAHIPQDLLDRLCDRLVAQPYEQIVDWLRDRYAAAGIEAPDLHTLAFVLIEPMSSFRAMREMFGRTLDDIDDERFIAAWVDVALAVAEQHGLALERRGDPAAPSRPDISS
jgi:hypothetical protein